MTTERDADLILGQMRLLCAMLAAATSPKSVVAGLIVTLAQYIDMYAKDDADAKEKLDNVIATLRDAVIDIRAEPQEDTSGD
jgi:hypothetical protein